MLYKILKGVEQHVSILNEEAKITELKRYIFKIVNELLNYFEKETALGDTFMNNGEKQIESIEKINKEERSNMDLFYLKEKCKTGLDFIFRAFSSSKYFHLVDRYNKTHVNKEITKYMSSKFKFSKLIPFNFSTKYPELMNEQEFLRLNEYKRYLKPLKKHYKEQKNLAILNPENSFQKMLCSEDKKRKIHLETLVQFFMDQINSMEVELKGKNYKKQFFNNEYYMYMIIIMDNLIRSNDKIKVALHRLLRNKDNNS